MSRLVKIISYCITLLLLASYVNLFIQIEETHGVTRNTLTKNQKSYESTNVILSQGNHQAKKEMTIKNVPGAAPDFRADNLKASPTGKALKSTVFMKAMSRFFGRLQPNQGGIIWLAIILTISIAADVKKLFSWRNLDILLLIVPSFLFIDLINLGAGGHTKNPNQFSLFGLVFLAIFVITLVLLIRAIIGVYRPTENHWTPNLSKPILVSLVIVLFLCNCFLALGRFPDDSGIYTNIGADQLVKTGRFPYGDPTLHGGAAATYGPLLYVAHVPFQLLFSGVNTSAKSETYSLASWLYNGGVPDYTGPPIIAAKLTLLLFHLLGVIGLVLIGKQLGKPAVGWAMACLYIGNACIQGLGGKVFFINGMTYVSHIAPAAITILAFASLNRPILAGTLLAAAAGILFYPAFFFPLWFGYYFWNRKGWRGFTIGFLLTCLLIGSTVLLMTDSMDNQNVTRVIYETTVGHQESKEAYGSSNFSFWGTHPRLAAFWQEPLIENMYLLKFSFLLFAIFLAYSFFMSRGISVIQLSFLTAATALAIQLWKSHAGGTYVAWYLPFLLVGFFGPAEHENRIKNKI